jgi:hypothetical protein
VTAATAAGRVEDLPPLAAATSWCPVRLRAETSWSIWKPSMSIVRSPIVRSRAASATTSGPWFVEGRGRFDASPVWRLADAEGPWVTGPNR